MNAAQLVAHVDSFCDSCALSATSWTQAVHNIGKKKICYTDFLWSVSHCWSRVADEMSQARLQAVQDELATLAGDPEAVRENLSDEEMNIFHQKETHLFILEARFQKIW